MKRILIANRGEIARRIIRTARALGLETVAVHSDPDAEAPFVREADLAVRLPGATSAETYLDAEALIAAARRSGADAVHPGYGFLSESPDFAEAVEAAGLTWIGPTPASIRAMALKIEAKRIAQEAGVPLAPGAELAEELTDAELVEACRAVGFPVLIKASAGGGGKGMRIVVSADEAVDAVQAARREARSSFGDGTVFVERYLAGARHVEVQVFGDTHGNVVHLFERECSIQRRHQKVVEESPSPGATERTRAGLYEAATSLTRGIGYVGAGTVEFLVFGEGEDQQFAFLEMNTRLQVEHPVTEAVTGIDLVAWQIAVAQGRPLPLRQEQISSNGHAIEVRLYAEDPANDYRPATGEILAIRTAGIPQVRVDSGVEPGSVITAYYDPMIAKVIAHGATRVEAAGRLARGLLEMGLQGPPSNRDSLLAILREQDFLAGRTTTAYLDEHPEVLDPPLAAGVEQRHVLAATAAAAWRASGSDGEPPGWRNVRAVRQRRDWQRRGAAETITVRYDWRREGIAADLGTGDLGDVRVRVDPDGHRVFVQIDGLGTDHLVSEAGDTWFVEDSLAATAWTAIPRFADASAEGQGHGPQAPVPGTVTAVLVAAGDAVVAGQTLVLLEAMKMEHRIVADIDGVVVAVHVEPGQSVEAHQVVVDLGES